MMQESKVDQSVSINDLQSEVRQFLSNPESYLVSGSQGLPNFNDSKRSVECINTHSAILYLAGNDVYKLKRAVKYSYLDMLALNTRKYLCEREYELNKPILPDIYKAVVPVTREADGSLCLDGKGTAVEWVLHMARFEENDVLDNIAQSHNLSVSVSAELGQSIAAYHRSVPIEDVSDGYARIREVVEELNDALTEFESIFKPGDLEQYKTLGIENASRLASQLDHRAATGYVRRCHGDLHLRNLLMYKGSPVPFDAMEFDERMATTDVLYDLAFLIMDLNHRGLHEHASIVLNNYLLCSDFGMLDGLALLPLFLYCRAGVRAMTSAQGSSSAQQEVNDRQKDACAYLELAMNFLKTREPVLIAVGGLSGTGKSTAAAAVSWQIGALPGAILLRSDAERKISEGVSLTTRLPDQHYNSESSRVTYNLMFTKAIRALEAGFSVVLDATFIGQEVREQAVHHARSCGVPFYGFWLNAGEQTLVQRLRARKSDVSDANVSVLEKQMDRPNGILNWSTIDAEGTPEDTLSQLLNELRMHDVV